MSNLPSQKVLGDTTLQSENTLQEQLKLQNLKTDENIINEEIIKKEKEEKAAAEKLEKERIDKEECQYCHQMVKDKASHEQKCDQKPQQDQNFITAFKKLKDDKNKLNIQGINKSRYYYKLPDDIFNEIDFDKKDFEDVSIMGKASNNVLEDFTSMVINMLGKLFSTPELINKLVEEVINQNETIDNTIIKYINKEINKQADKYKRGSALITFYFTSQKGTAFEQKNLIRKDLQNLLYKNNKSKKLWMNRLKEYVKSAIKAGKEHSPPKEYIKWEDIK